MKSFGLILKQFWYNDAKDESSLYPLISITSVNRENLKLLNSKKIEIKKLTAQ